MLKGKLGLVTGGAGSIGSATCKELALEGARVIVADLDQERCDQVARDLPGSGHMGLAMNVAEGESVKSGFQTVFDKYGVPADHVVNCAGIVPPEFVSILEIKDEDFDNVVNVNLKGTLLVDKYAARWMKERGVKGSIINIASLLGKTASIGWIVYGSTKAGVISLTKSASRELGGYGIRVNCVCPAYISTPLKPGTDTFAPSAEHAVMFQMRDKIEIPLNRDGQPHEVGNICAFLASEKASYMTGSIVDITGGLFYFNADCQATGKPIRDF